MESNTHGSAQRNPAASMLRYAPPQATVIGSITELTASKSGSHGDFLSNLPNAPLGSDFTAPGDPLR
jgi:hypothetical protein